MKTLRLIPLVVALTACASVSVPVSPYRIDVQQGNALEQEAVDKLKVGMTASQVRFLLGTPLLVDPFRNNRWDYVYNYRKAGKLTEKRRLALFFEGDVLTRVDAEGFAPKPVAPEQAAVAAVKAEEKPSATPEAAKVAAAKVESPKVVATTEPAPAPPPRITPSVEQAAAPKPVLPAPQPVAAATTETPQPKTGAEKKASAERVLNETSIVPPMTAAPQPAGAKPNPVTVSEKPPETVALQAETNVAAVVPDVVPSFPGGSLGAAGVEGQVMAALNAWANAWKSRDEEAYLAAYAASFKPAGGLTRMEWEKRRRLLLGLARNIDLRIDGHAFESIGEDKAQVSFRQYYRSDSYQDAVIKQIKFVRVDNLWLIEDEKILAPIKVKK